MNRAQNVISNSIGQIAGWDRTYAVTAHRGGWIAAGRRGRSRGVAIVHARRAPAWASKLARRLKGTRREEGGLTFLILEGSHETLKALRESIPFLSPVPAGKRPSFGYGDRTGLALPGHLASLQGSPFFPVFAQQSIREMSRTRRSPDEVMDAAVFGALQCGYTGGFGADADHLKTREDVDLTAGPGFVVFTLDSAEVLTDGVPKMGDAELEKRYREIIAEVAGASKWEKRYGGKTFRFRGKRGSFSIKFDERTLRESVVKFGRAVAHSAGLAAHVKKRKGRRPYEIEIAVDETPVDTAHADHVFLVRELQARGVRVDAFAPKFIAGFEKGVDYKGSRPAFERFLERHDAIARAQGGYKISVHSGSDKFSLYPAIARATRNRFHLKTAGTSYMEALRVVARKDPGMFREMVDHAREQFRKDRASYHVSGRPDEAPPTSGLSDEDLERVYVVEDDGRQIMHVTYGSVLSARTETGWRFRERLLDLLVREEETHEACLAKHLGRHVSLCFPRRRRKKAKKRRK